MTTAVASGDYDDSNDGFTFGERVRITAGNNAGKFGVIIQILDTPGYYVVTPEGTQELTLLEFNEIEPVITPPAAPVPAYGMTAADLASYVADFTTRTTARVIGTGQEQYDLGDRQKFEDMGLPALLEMLQEELRDQAVYAAMGEIRIERIKQELINRGVV